MGFFGGSKTKIPATGYYALPGDLKGQYTDFYNAIPGATAAQNFTLPDYNPDQSGAFQMARDAANPTAQGIQNLVSAYQNPFNESVISEINRQSQGPYSILKQALSQSGQLGSNRQMLGANDVDLSRQNQIGSFLQSQFNNSLNTGLNAQQLGFQNLLGIGNQQQQQAYQNQLAPYQGLEAQAGLLNPVVQYMGASTPAQTIKTGGGLGGILGGISNIAQMGSGVSNLFGGGGFFGAGGGLSSLGTLFSDRRLKENIKYKGKENGHKVYEFNYLDNPHTRYIGVIAQEVEETHPEAVIELLGYKRVNYGKIGVNFRPINGMAA